MLHKGVYLQIQPSIPQKELKFITRALTYPILGQFSHVAVIVLEENLFLSCCLEFSSARNDLSKARERESKSLKGLAQTLHLRGGHSEVKRIRLPQ